MKREQKLRKIRDCILILTNGKQTEKNYFSCLTLYYKSMYSIEVKFVNEQCDGLVKFASKIDKNEYNQIWCVFDIDESFNEGHLVKAITQARKNNIRLAFSNESFEVWLLYHLIDNVNKSLSRKDYIGEINKLLQTNNRNLEYEKNDTKLIKDKFIPNVLIATQRAKKIYQKEVVEFQKYNKNIILPIWDWKSTTSVYQLIEALKLANYIE